MNANAKKKKPTVDDHPLSQLIAVGIVIAVLIMILDFFDVGFFDGAGPGAAVLFLGLGILVLFLEGLQTGRAPTARSYISRKTSAALYWISVATYAVSGIIISVIGVLMITGVIES